MHVKPYHLLFAAFFAFTAVILGAFGAHALKEVLSADQVSSFETGVRYQMYHALALLVIAMKGHHYHLRYERWVTSLFGIGILLFSGSIYLLNLQEILGMSLPWLGPVTPIGGTLLIAGWALLLVEAIRLIALKKA